MAIWDSFRNRSNKRDVEHTFAVKSDSGETKTFRSKSEVLQRVSPLDLETIYIREGTVYNWINKVVESFLACDFRVQTNNERERRIMEEFLRASDFRNLLKITTQHLMIYGNSFWESWLSDL